MNRRKTLGLLGGSLLTGFTATNMAVAGPGKLRGYIRSNWSRDPRSYGAYSYVPKGVMQAERRHLQAPVGDRLFFAGEAVFSKYNSTVHAAFASGRHTARMLRQSGAGKVAIIGAGMSGLAAAKLLARRGIDVAVFEARSKIGGRIRTDGHLGMPLDIGASWIHGIRGNPLTNLANKAGMASVATDDSYVTRGRGGRRIPDSAFPNWLEDVVMIQQNAGADVDQINMNVYNNEPGFDGPEVVFPDGYAAIFNSLKGAYHLRLSTKVQAVTLTDDGVSLGLATGADEAFDAVIVTVPLGVMKRGDIRFSPALPARKQTAINRLGMGLLDKLYLKFDKPFWDRDVTWIVTPENGLPRGQFNQWLNMYKITGAPVIMAFNGGTPALDLAGLPDRELINRATQTLAAAYPQ